MMTFLFAVINVWFYIMTNSRMAFAASSMFILFMIVQKMNNHKWKWIGRLNILYKILPEIICAIH